MKTIQPILGLKQGREFSIESRKKIVEDYLRSGKTKREIWKKYTGQEEEHGQLLKWMRQMGYDIPKKWNKIAIQTTQDMAKSKNQYSVENSQLKEKIAELEKALINSELRSTAYETMIEIAEKELKINIRKKSNTKQSIQ